MNAPAGIALRAEAAGDAQAIAALHRAAFAGEGEARLVDALRVQARPLVSLVAEQDDGICGHILFSPVALDGFEGGLLMGLAPMAVAPALQRSGIGSALVQAGLAQCRAIGAAGVVVLGHPAYYPRFGFRRADGCGLGCEYDAPPEAFMALELRTGAFDGARGTVRYHPAFAQL